MLYERWRQIVRENRNELALHDIAIGERWTFVQLDTASERGKLITGPIAFPQSISAEFVLTVLRAWRAGQFVCPLEEGQAPPSFAQLPKGCIHLKTTSATSGPSRAIAFTGKQLAADAENIVATMSLRRDWPNLGVISLAHSYGFSNLVLPLLLHGIPLIVANSPLPEVMRQAATVARCLTLAAVPALWRAWHDANAIPENIRLAISAGAPLSLSLEQAVFDATGVKLHNFYGSSECGGIAYDSTNVPRTNATCVGAPVRNVELSVNADDCLEIRSQAVGQTYWPETSPNLSDGCYRTSDLAELKDGLVFLRGRASDLINIAGRKVSPEIIERVLLTHPDVKECLVLGVPSNEAERSETIVAVVAGGQSLTGDSLKQLLLTRLPAWQVPREWCFVDSLEINQRGKLSRAEWRRKLLER